MFPLSSNTRSQMKRALFSVAMLVDNVRGSYLIRNPDAPLNYCAEASALLKALGEAFERGDVAFASASSLERFFANLIMPSRESKVGRK
jgi:hypothetical protein